MQGRTALLKLEIEAKLVNRFRDAVIAGPVQGLPAAAGTRLQSLVRGGAL